MTESKPKTKSENEGDLGIGQKIEEATDPTSTLSGDHLAPIGERAKFADKSEGSCAISV